MLKSRISIVVAVALVAATVPLAAAATPAGPSLGPAIDPSPGYQGMRKCSPTDKPGVVEFRKRVLNAYPGTGYGSISRGCNIGGDSEHKEGRAWDWGVNAGNASQLRHGSQARHHVHHLQSQNLVSREWLERLLQAEAEGLRVAGRRGRAASSHRSRPFQFHVEWSQETHDVLAPVPLDDRRSGRASGL